MNRRRFLQAAGVSLALPQLDIDAAASTKTKKVRLACFYFPNGSSMSSWRPEKYGADGQLIKLNASMKSLEPFKNDIVIPYEIISPQGNGHGKGTATWLSGGGYNYKKLSVGSPSMDQLAARHLRSQTPLASLELSTKGEGYFSRDITRNNISWLNSDLPTTRETEPRAVFDSMFRPNNSNINSASILDLIKEQAADVARKGSANDKRKINEYLESVRSIERKIQRTEHKQEALKKFQNVKFDRPKAGIPANHKEYIRLMLDLIVLGFYVDMTRVSTFMMDHGQSVRYCDFVPGVKGTWHALSHYKDISGKSEDDDGKTSWKSVAEKKAMYHKVVAWHNEQMAYFLGRMKSLQTPEGSLLENSLILYGSSLGDGHSHGEKLPIIFAGGGGGKVRNGICLKKKEAIDLNEWHLSALNILGAKAKRFGSAVNGLEGYLK